MKEINTYIKLLYERFDKSTVEITSWYLLWRVGLFIVGILSYHQMAANPAVLVSLDMYPLWRMWHIYDVGFYTNIALHGYDSVSAAFFPAFPVTLRALYNLTFQLIDIRVISFLLSNILFLLALLKLRSYIELKFGQDTARSTIVWILAFPISFFFGIGYSESFFLFLTVWAFDFAYRKNFLMAGVFAALASTSRLVGVAVILAIIVESFLRRDKKNNKWWLSLIGLAGPILVGAIYYWSLGDPLAFLHSYGEHSWDRSISFEGYEIFAKHLVDILKLNVFSPNGTYLTSLFEALPVVLSIMAMGYFFYKKEFSWSLFTLIAIMIPLTSGTLISINRYIIIIFPIYVMLSLIFRNNLYIPFIVSLPILGYFTARFVAGWWIG